MDVLISADRLLTGQPGEQIIDGAVLVRDHHIVAVGSQQQIADQPDKPGTELHYPGGTLLPGLINTHVHLVFDASLDPVAAYRACTPETLLLAMAERAHQCLDAGVTTIRDLGDGHGLAIRLRGEIAAGTRYGPRILSAGAPLTVPGGHCWFLGGEVDGQDSIRARIHATAAAGADVIKVMASGGHMTPSGAAMWESQFTRERLRLIVDEARSVGLPVAAHAHGSRAIADAVTAGVTTVEHCTWMTGPGQSKQHEDIARQMAAAGAYAGDTTPPNWTDLAAMLPPGPGHRFGDRLPWMDQLGVKIIIGTDAGLPGAVFGDFVSALHTHASYPIGHLSTMYWIGLRPGDVHLNVSSPGWAKHAWSNVFAPWNAAATVCTTTPPGSTPTACSTPWPAAVWTPSARRRRSGGCSSRPTSAGSRSASGSC